MKEKKAGGFLRWPWNVVIYVALFLVLRLFAVPIILVLMWVQQKNNPHGVEEGYCLSRTRKRLVWLIWALVVLALAVVCGVMFVVGLKQDRTYWDKTDYITLAFAGGGAVLLGLLGLWLGYTSVRDAFFPAKSTLAQSIRNQMPYPDEAPPVDELFAMVDKDLQENGQWFGAVGIGREWVLGDVVNRIDRIRGIFVINEIHMRHTSTGSRTNRNMELVLVDDRWQRNATTFRNLKDLQAAADCLALRVPDARRGTNGQCSSFLSMDDSAKENFEQAFRQRQNRRASEEAQREVLRGGSQDMILKRRGGEVTSRLSDSVIEEQLRRCLSGAESGFELMPTRPIEGGGKRFRSLNCFVQTDGVGEPKVLLLLELDASGDDLALALTTDARQAGEILRGWLRREVPDLTGWDLRRMYVAPQKTQPAAQRPSRAKLSLVYASGAAENHTTFTKEDLQMAAEGIVDGTYQLVDLTHPEGYLWIRVTAGDKTDGRCTVEATKPGGPELEFYIAKMPPKEAAAWLTDYPQRLPGGGDWKKVKKPK